MAGDVCLSVDIESVTSSFTASIKEFISSSSKAEPSVRGPSLADVLSGSPESCLLTGGSGGHLPHTAHRWRFLLSWRTKDGGWLVGGGRTVH